MQFSCLKIKIYFSGSGKKELYGAAFLLQDILLLGMMSEAWGEGCPGRGSKLIFKMLQPIIWKLTSWGNGSLKDKRAYQKSRLDKCEPFFQQAKTALSEKVNSVMRRHQLRILVFPSLLLCLQGDACLRAPFYLQFPPQELINYLFLFRFVVSWNFILTCLPGICYLFILKMCSVSFTPETPANSKSQAGFKSSNLLPSSPVLLLPPQRYVWAICEL